MKSVNTKLALIVAIAIMMFISPLINAFAENAEEDKAIKPPAAVMAAFHKAYPSAKVRNVFIETKDNVDYIEIESMDNGLERDLLYFPNGTVFEIEEQITTNLLPAKVLAGVKAKFPKGIIKTSEKVIRNGRIVEYGVIIEDGEKGIELLLSPKGVIKTQESVSDNDEVSDTGDGDVEEAGEDGEADEGGEED